MASETEMNHVASISDVTEDSSTTDSATGSHGITLTSPAKHSKTRDTSTKTPVETQDAIVACKNQETPSLHSYHHDNGPHRDETPPLDEQVSVFPSIKSCNVFSIYIT